jgi:hypothetical protein
VAVLESFTRSTFAPLVGETFRLQVDPSPVDVVLTEATELPAHAQTSGRAPFSLVFLGPPTVLPQGTYRMTNAGVGAFEIFLVPIGAGADGAQYEAVFT